jgi:hypothetical protein
MSATPLSITQATKICLDYAYDNDLMSFEETNPILNVVDASGNSKAKAICRNFNSEKGCSRTPCAYKHEKLSAAGGNNKANSSVERKCWSCQSTKHMLDKCPKKDEYIKKREEKEAAAAASGAVHLNMILPIFATLLKDSKPWILDGAASKHITTDELDFDGNAKELNGSVVFTVGNDSIMVPTHVGKVTFGNITLSEVYLCKECPVKLISESQLILKGVCINKSSVTKTAQCLVKDKTIFVAKLNEDGLFHMDQVIEGHVLVQVQAFSPVKAPILPVYAHLAPVVDVPVPNDEGSNPSTTLAGSRELRSRTMCEGTMVLNPVHASKLPPTGCDHTTVGQEEKQPNNFTSVVKFGIVDIVLSAENTNRSHVQTPVLLSASAPVKLQVCSTDDPKVLSVSSTSIVNIPPPAPQCEVKTIINTCTSVPCLAVPSDSPDVEEERKLRIELKNSEEEQLSVSIDGNDDASVPLPAEVKEDAESVFKDQSGDYDQQPDQDGDIDEKHVDTEEGDSATSLPLSLSDPPLHVLARRNSSRIGRGTSQKALESSVDSFAFTVTLLNCDSQSYKGSDDKEQSLWLESEAVKLFNIQRGRVWFLAPKFAGHKRHPDNTVYQRKVRLVLLGRLIWLTNTRPDIMQLVEILCRDMGRYNQDTWNAAKDVQRYLKETSSYGIVFNIGPGRPPARGQGVLLSAACDSDGHG